MCFKEEKLKIHKDQILGNAYSLAAAEGYTAKELLENGPQMLYNMMENEIQERPHEVIQKYEKSKDKQHFISSPPRPNA